MNAAKARVVTGMVVAFGVLLLAFSAPASARDREVQAIPLDFVGLPFCSDEEAEYTGTLLVTQAETIDATGAAHDTGTARLVDGLAVGTVTGTTYRVLEVDHSSQLVRVDGQVRSIFTANGVLIGTGVIPNANVHIEVIVLIDADGNVTIPVWDIHVTCGG